MLVGSPPHASPFSSFTAFGQQVELFETRRPQRATSSAFCFMGADSECSMPHLPSDLFTSNHALSQAKRRWRLSSKVRQSSPSSQVSVGKSAQAARAAVRS